VRGVIDEFGAAGGDRVVVEIVDQDGAQPGGGALVAPELEVSAIEIAATATAPSIADLGIPGGDELGALQPPRA
jgi:hypothetical protein